MPTLALLAPPTHAKQRRTLLLPQEEWQDDTPTLTPTPTQAETITDDVTNNITIHDRDKSMTPTTIVTSPRTTSSPRLEKQAKGRKPGMETP